MKAQRIITPDTGPVEIRTTISLIAYVLGVVGLSLFAFIVTRNIVTGLPLDVLAPGEVPDTQGTAESIEALTEEDLAAVSWDEGKVTILLMGIDERKFEEGPARTDTLILLTIDPETMHMGMLSIPRDLWVEIPGYGVHDKINTAFFRGEADQYPGGGGPALAADTIQYNMGVNIDYYATVNFQAFVDIIDEIGCIPMTVPQTIDDPTYPAPDGYGYEPFHLDAGEYCMGGETLLKYARTRATYGGDFDRSARQQQVIQAVRDYVMESGQLASLIAKAPQIYEAVSGGVRTDMTLQQGISLGLLAMDVERDNLCSEVLSGRYVDMQKLPDGVEILIPMREPIRELLIDLWSGTGSCAEGYVSPLATPAPTEQPVITPSGQSTPVSAPTPTLAPTGEPTIGVFNGTETPGLASTAAAVLTNSGYTVTFIGNSDLLYDQTVVLSYRGYDVQAITLANLLGIPVSAVQAGDVGRYDIEIILGADYPFTTP